MKIKQFFIATITILCLSACEKESSTLNENLLELPTEYENMVTGEFIKTVPWEELPESIQNVEFTNPDGVKTEEVEATTRSGCYDFWTTTPAHGGHGGGVFVLMPESSCHRIDAIVVKFTGSIRTVFFVYERQDGSLYIPSVPGGTDGSFFAHGFADNEIITRFTTSYKETVNSFGFDTRNKITGQSIAAFELGTRKGTFSPYNYGIDKQIHGIYGEAGNRINKLGALIYQTEEN